MKTPSEIIKALEATGKPYEIVKGSRHQKLKLNGQLVGILPLKAGGDRDRRAMMNVLSQIKRAGRGVPAGHAQIAA
jgi:predicted RNA binding protein YcfA (HicA-like mRNA interferase family)